MEISLDALRAMILAQQQKIVGMEAANRAYEALIQALELTIARLKRQKYGASSEKIDREIAQLALALEGLEMAGAATDPTPQSDAPADDRAADDPAAERRLPPRRRGKPRIAADAPREVITLDPGQRCPDCGGTLRLVGEDVALILDFIAAKLKVIEVHRPKKSCRDCERMVQSPAPSKARRPLIRSPEETGPAGPGGPADPAWPGRSRVARPSRRYWRISWSRSSTITFRSTGRAKSLPARRGLPVQVLLTWTPSAMDDPSPDGSWPRLLQRSDEWPPGHSWVPTSPARRSSTGAARPPAPSDRSPI